MRIAVDGRLLQRTTLWDSKREYLQGWIQAVQEQDTPFSFWLLHDPGHPKPDLPLSSPKWQWCPLSLPFSHNTSQAAHSDGAMVFDSALESFLLEHEFDLFLTYDSDGLPTGRRIFRTRWVISFSDLAFLRHPVPGQKRSWQEHPVRRLGAVVYAQRVQTPTETLKSALCQIAAVAPERIDCVPMGVDSAYKPLPEADTWHRLAALGLDEPYLLGILNPQSAMNALHLLHAYSHLGNRWQRRFRLVLEVTDPSWKVALHRHIAMLGLQDRIVVLDRADRERRVALYNGAVLLVYIPRHDDLALPLLEAMRCGTPVVAADVAPLTELAGEGAEFVPSDSPSGIARGLKRVLESASRRQQMRHRGLAQTAGRTWARTAEAVLRSLRLASHEPRYSSRRAFPTYAPRRHRRLRLAFWTPLNPQPSGISEYSLFLVTELGKEADVDVFIDGYRPSDQAMFDSFPIFDAKAFPYLNRRFPYDLNIYQIGNNPLHLYMYEAALARPGLVTLHDLCVYHLVHAALMQSGNAGRFWQEVAYSEGPEVARWARRMYKQGTLDPYRLLLNKRLVRASRGIVVHSKWAMRRVRDVTDAPPVRVIPMGTVVWENDNGRFGRLVRRMLGLPSDAFIFGTFGKLHHTKRISIILRAFSRVRRRRPHAVLLLAGLLDPTVLNDLGPFLQDPLWSRAQGVYIRGNEAGFGPMLLNVQAVDAGLNLRYPTAGETSWTLHTLLGQGKPTIVSDVGTFTEYPDACCPKTPIGEEEENVLVRHMLALVDDRSFYNRASQAAYAYSKDKTWPLCAQRYLDFAEAILEGDAG